MINILYKRKKLFNHYQSTLKKVICKKIGHTDSDWFKIVFLYLNDSTRKDNLLVHNQSKQLLFCHGNRKHVLHVSIKLQKHSWKFGRTLKKLWKYSPVHSRSHRISCSPKLAIDIDVYLIFLFFSHKTKFKNYYKGGQ